MRMRGMFIVTGIISISVILTGCFQGEQSLEKVDPPQDATEVSNTQGKDAKATKENATEKSSKEKAEKTTETQETQLYLLDSNGMVVPQTLELPATKEVATQALEYLVKDGPVTQLLPNGFQAVLPAGTEVLGLDLQEDGTMIVDVSNNFKDYKAEQELEILQAMTYTLTQFDSVDKVKLWINGYPVDSMPVNGTPVSDGYSRANGINMIQTDTIDYLGSTPVTLYYPAAQDDLNYFVPVTQHIKMDDKNEYESIVSALIDGSKYNNNVVQVFNSSVSLTEEPQLNDGVLKLVFSDDILMDKDQATISDQVMETLVRTLTEDKEVEAVDVKVNKVKQVFNESGKAYTEPVTKKMVMPTGKL
ncbi:spore gernimation protein [Virgibacillus phasianinus]|uniref:Spore gernimation protein n=1 Tax=Virgibacillus phasianinus TaxID=2017483 RepID=A0A220U4E6_9BACI|nr:GerMN domain-containing protein [Virgibacillus phasianinus]ASK63038.1 spore gernimation protein [Virgibacillus phasianinus]